MSKNRMSCFWYLAILILLLMTGCVNSLPSTYESIPTATALPTPTQTIAHYYGAGSWVNRTPYQWSHDGFPYEGEHFIVYSNGATMDEKILFAEKAEDVLEFVMQTLHVS